MVRADATEWGEGGVSGCALDEIGEKRDLVVYDLDGKGFEPNGE